MHSKTAQNLSHKRYECRRTHRAGCVRSGSACARLGCATMQPWNRFSSRVLCRPRTVCFTPSRAGENRVPTIVDVAKRAGVSRQTVSRVINDSPDVRSATRERVMETIRELGYQADTAARALGRRRGTSTDPS
ncbi:LacI family DNA-binding transcriptional regulator [Microbacterium sp. 1P10UB]|uniref:LacI family DNA-binding transcriptional regulator n=1 Tax=unclassified Microbacterium TaxID=2609290 RepID=UPI00399FB7AF